MEEGLGGRGEIVTVACSLRVFHTIPTLEKPKALMTNLRLGIYAVKDIQRYSPTV